MKDLTKYLDNPFDDLGISLAELQAFSTDHLEKMKAQNGSGQWTERIAATEPAMALVNTAFATDLTKLGLRGAQKQMKDDYRKALPTGIAKIAASVVAQYGPNSPVDTECFPQGRKAFSDCRDDELEEHLQTMITGVSAHQVELGMTVVANAQALLTGWQAVYTASEVASGNKTAAETSKKFARENLQLMLFLNLLKIAEVYARQPQMLARLMTQSLLENRRPVAPAPTPPPPTPPTP